jgi:hypothetical protein
VSRAKRDRDAERETRKGRESSRKVTNSLTRGGIQGAKPRKRKEKYQSKLI